MVVREGFMEKGTLEPKLKEVRESTTQVLGRSIPAEQPGNGRWVRAFGNQEEASGVESTGE